LLQQVDLKDRAVVIDQVKRVQRLFRLSSGPESMKVLLDAGFHSARDLAGLPFAVAMDVLKPALGETAARLMLDRANSIAAETIHKFVILNDQINGQIPQTLKLQKAANEIGDVGLTRGPDYASLFGSVELCDCQDCRSIHSPAAYLVDLLQFLSIGLKAENPLVTPLDVLIGNDIKNVKGRRPDIAHLQLSCENTNTTLPYVDLVNEALESFIAFNQTLPLKVDANGAVLVPSLPLPDESSVGVSAADLAANPENIHDLAYEKLEAAVYPFALPFNQPLTSLRLTLDRMGSSRHEVMDLFRADDGEAAGRALDVEALGLTEREFGNLTGERFDGQKIATPVPDFFGFEAPAEPSDTNWVAGSLPASAQQHVDKDSWTFAAFAPPPPSNTTPHASAVAAGVHQHFFDKVSDAEKLEIGDEDFLFAEIFLDPVNLPQQVMIEWNDGTWEHRAYWGLSKIANGVEGTASLRYMGPLPAAGEWARLEVPSYFVGVAGRRLSGMGFTLFGGGATWGAAGKRSPSWVESLTHVPTLISRTGITYAELLDLVRTHYVNPALPTGEELLAFERIPISYGALASLVARDFVDPDPQTLKALADADMSVADLAAWASKHFESVRKLLVLDAPDSACDLTLTRLQHLDGTALDDAELTRLHRFIRLWRKLDWTIKDLDRSHLALGATETTPTFLRQLGNIVQLHAAINLSPQELLSFWSNIPTAGDDSLYHKLFLNKAVREVDAAFAPVDGEYLPVTGTLKIKDHVPALLAGLHTRAVDLDLIRKRTKLDSDDAPLNLATATTLYRYVWLARALKLAVQDLIYLEVLSSEQPFSTLSATKDGFADIDPARTLRFVRLTERVKQSGDTPASLSYLFAELAEGPSGLAPADESINLLLATLREGLIHIAVENESSTDDPNGEVTRAKLALLFEAHTVEQLAGLIAGTKLYSAPLASKPPPLAKGKVTYDEPTHLLKAAGWLTETDLAGLLALPDVEGFPAAVRSLFDQPRELIEQTLAKNLGWATAANDLKASVLETTSLKADGTIDPALVAGKHKAFLTEALPFLRATLSRAFVKQTLADALNLDPSVAALLLEGNQDIVPLGSDARKELPAIVDFLSLSGDGLQATYFATLERPLQARLAQLSTAANPWLASRASIAVANVRTLAATPSGETKTVKDLPVATQIFNHGVLQAEIFYPLLYPAEFRFQTLFHPYAVEFHRRLNRSGVAELLNIDSQRPIESQHPRGLPKLTSFGDAYKPNLSVRKPWPEHNVDFEFTGAYSLYNWEIFFHVPLFIATRLSQSQRFEEALKWFHFIFDPTTAASETDPAPQCFWNVLPLRNVAPLRLDDMLKAMKAGDADLTAQWDDLQAHPFHPHRIARMRRIAYQKTVVMKYIDTLVAWADQLFRRDTIETINQATQLYVMAAELLGPRPERLPQRERNQSKTYDQLCTTGLDKLNQAIVSFENDLPFSSHATASDGSTSATGLLGLGRTFYFGIPKNDKLLGYWDTVADRLFKIRHCMNIEGVVRSLSLFEPPIDPALLVQAAAQGVDLSSVFNDLSAPLPLYRFSTLLGKALELTNELRSLGGALLSALEKRDTEHLSNLRATHEKELLSLVKLLKQQQLKEATETGEGLQKSRDVIQTRFDFYNSIPDRIPEESNQLFQLEQGRNFLRFGQTAENIISDLQTNLPDMTTGWGYSTSGGWQQKADITWGRSNVIAHYQANSRANSYDSSVRVSWANDASILGGWRRRADEWRLQRDLAFKELAQIDKQLQAAQTKVAVAQQDLDNTVRQIEQSEEVQEFLRNKYTGEELYSWMQGEISSIYFQCYQMTYDLAKKAERCYRFELGVVNSNFIQFGAWDSLRKGLLSAERLYLQLKQMERSYLDGNRREFELTKHYSLLMNDPQSLVELKGLGQCEIDLAESLFDGDYSGHYLRRIKSVSLSIPAVVGPYTGVNCTLTLLRDKTRVKATPADGYAERDNEEDDRFMTNWAPLQAIATSTGQNDTGLFELNFHDERYLPFEGAGAISRWRIVLDPDANAFDFNTLSDVVLHIRYTAREGGERLRKSAQESLALAIGEQAAKPLARLFSLKHEFPTEWHRFTHAAVPGATGTFTIDKERFPFLFRGKNKTLTVGKVHLYAVLKHGAEPALPLSVVLTPPGGEKRIEFELIKKWGEILAPKNIPDLETKITATPADSKWVLKVDPGDLVKNLDDLLLMCEYTVELNR
jgi:receptor-binding and translocation channel-forming TcA subunit of Tc toxin/virulence plasmid A protein